MNQRNQGRFGSSNDDRDRNRGGSGGSGGWTEGSYRGGAMRGSSYVGSDRDDERQGTQGYGMNDYGGTGYGSSRGAGEYDMRDYNDGRGRDFGNDDGRWQQRDFSSSDFRGDRESYGGSRNGGDDRWNMPGNRGGQGEYRGSNDYRSQGFRGEGRGAGQGGFGMHDGMLGYGFDGGSLGRDFGTSQNRGYGDGFGRQGSAGMSSSVGGSYGMRNKGGRSGYGDVSDLGRSGGYGGGSIDYGAAYNRGNQDFWRGRGENDHDGRGDRSFGDRVEDWGHRAKEGIKDFFGGPRNYKRSDDRIREDVCDRLQQLGSRGHLDPSDIEVSVKDGEVTLSGTVPQRDWKHRAEDLAEAVSGVKEVENRIRVQKQDASGLAGKSGKTSPSTTASGTSSLSGGNNNGTTSATAKS